MFLVLLGRARRRFGAVGLTTGVLDIRLVLEGLLVDLSRHLVVAELGLDEGAYQQLRSLFWGLSLRDIGCSSKLWPLAVPPRLGFLAQSKA